MSAKNDPKVKHNGEYSFDMPEAIPSYLIALAVGDLRFKETGPRTGVMRKSRCCRPPPRNSPTPKP